MTSMPAIGEPEAPWRAELHEALSGARPSAASNDARTSPAGRRQGERRRPTVVLLDVDVPGVSAGELARQLGDHCRVVRITTPEAPDAPLRWITALHGRELRLIAVDEVCYCRSDHKYTAVVTADDESLIRMPLRQLTARLDPAVFWQIHRGAVVNAHAIQSIRRDDCGQLEVRLKARSETLKVSEPYAHRFKHL